MTDSLDEAPLPQDPKAQLREKWCRPVGVVMALGGVIAAKFFVFDYLDSLKHSHQAAIEYDSHIIFLPVVLVVLGLLMACFGSKNLQNLKTPDKKLTKAGWLIVALTIGLLFAADTWFQSQLSSLGYSIMR